MGELTVKSKVDGKTEEVTHLVYRRSQLHTLHSVDRWPREGRKVREDELDKPYKYVKAREEVKNKRIDDKTPLYGKWQTDPYEVAPVADDQPIPRNEYGDINYFPGQQLPAGMCRNNSLSDPLLFHAHWVSAYANTSSSACIYAF